MLLLAALLLGACSTRPASPDALQWGLYVPDDGSPVAAVSQVATPLGDKPDYVLRFAAIDEPVPTAALTEIADAGMTPLLTLEPWVPAGGVDQPGYALARIAAGDHDAALNRWASEVAAWGRPVLLRFAHEMNGTWSAGPANPGMSVPWQLTLARTRSPPGSPG